MAYPTVTVHHKKYPHTSVMCSPYLCDNTGTLDCAADLEDLKAYLSNVGEIFFPEGTYLISANLVIPVGMVLRGPKAILSVAAGCTLTINSALLDDAPSFVTAATGAVVFAATSVLRSSRFDGLANLIDSLSGSNGITIIVDESESLSADLTIASNISLKINKGAVLTVANTKTITINGPFEAGLYQVFNDQNTDYDGVVFGSGAVEYVRPEWWAVNTTPGTTGMGAAIQCADNAASGTDQITPVAKVKFLGTTYLFDATVNKSCFTAWEGAQSYTFAVHGSGTRFLNGQAASMIKMYGTSGYLYTGYSCRFSDIYCHNDDATYPDAVALDIYLVRQLIFENMMIINFGVGLGFNACGEVYGFRVFSECAFGIYSLLGADYCFIQCFLGGDNGTSNLGYSGLGDGSITFDQCRFQMNKDGWGGQFVASWGLQFSNCIADGNTLGGLWFVNCTDVSSNNLRAFNNGAQGTYIPAIQITATTYEIDSVNATTDRIIFAADTTLATLSPVEFTTTDTLPAGLSTGRTYWLYRLVAFTEYKVCDTLDDARDGSGIDITDVGTGTHTVKTISQGFNFTGGCLYDESYPQSADRKQYYGFIFNNDGGIIQGVTLNGIDMSRCYDPYVIIDDAPVNFNILGCLGVAHSYVPSTISAMGYCVTPQLIEYAATVAVDMSLGSYAVIDCAANAAITINVPTGFSGWQFLYLDIIKAANTLTITWGAGIKAVAATTAVTASKRVIFTFIFDGTDFRLLGTPIETAL
jgi:hypothetical protein